jgi:N-acetylated-alpha-linked acidic dipeptidase
MERCSLLNAVRTAEASLAPEREAAVPYLEFASLDNAVRRLKASAKAYDEAVAAKGAGLSAADRRRLSELLPPILSAC